MMILSSHYLLLPLISYIVQLYIFSLLFFLLYYFSRRETETYGSSIREQTERKDMTVRVSNPVVSNVFKSVFFVCVVTERVNFYTYKMCVVCFIHMKSTFILLSIFYYIYVMIHLFTILQKSLGVCVSE